MVSGQSGGPSVDAVGWLTPRGAERMVAEWRYRYGLGQAYQLQVRSNRFGQWEVEDGLGGRDVVEPMSVRGFERWLMDRYGDVIAERQQTSEG